jgi:iron-sulfur cluster repair protein YtfE (RIC family)
MRHPSLVPLSHDHHHGLTLALRCRKQALGQIKPMGAVGLRERADEVLSFYDSNLLAHFRVEEEVLFPGLRSISPRAESIITELIDDHGAIDGLVEQLRTARGLAKVMFDLGDLLERHIRMEERELFPIFEQEIDAAQAEAIGSEMKRRFEAGQHR